MQKHVFQPAGLADTRVFNLMSATAPLNRVYGFKRPFVFFNNRTELHDLNNFDGVAGDGGIYSTAMDLYRWHNALLDETFLPVSVYQSAYQSGVLADGGLTGYGYGWFIRAPNMVEHAGGWRGFSSYYYRNLRTGKVIVVLDNSSNALRVGSRGFRFTSIVLNLIRYVEALP
jgi:CubicO group peptidase (beta-lactamase class C family)